MFSKMSMDSEGNHTVSTFEWSWVVCGWCSEGGVDVDFIEMSHGSLMFLQMAFCAETYSTCIASEGSLKVVDVNMKSQLRGFGENFLANSAN